MDKTALFHIKTAFIFIILVHILSACKENPSQQSSPSLLRIADRTISVIPTPNTTRFYEGKTPLFPKLCMEEAPASLSDAVIEFQKAYNTEITKWKRVYKKFFDSIPNIKDTCLTLHFIKDPSLAEEGYTLHLREQITLRYSSEKGAYYALKTLEQMVQNEMIDGLDGYFHLLWMDVEDAPRFSYRGSHLDVSRHFMKIEDIKRYITVMAYYKLNTLHLHLTDDQGWRMEIKRYPKLQTIASKRSQTIIGHAAGSTRYDHKPHGGYYTQKELKDLVAFARKRQIDIIPEIEIPGHSRAILAAYPELSCDGKRLPVATTWGVFDQVLCPKPETFTFLEGVLDEVMEVFPSPYIHIGGDECPTKSWEKSPFCQELMKKKDMQNPHEIEGYIIQKIADYLRQKGRTIIGWDEILDSSIPKDAIIMAWRGMDRGIKAAEQGHRVIMTPGAYCYLDHYQSLSENEPLAIGGYTPLAKVYSFDPAPDSIPAKIRENIIGLQANIWTEYMKDFDAVSYMAFPRLLAIAEIGWTLRENMDYTRFVESVVDHLYYLRKHGMKYSKAFKIPQYTTNNKGGFTYIKLHTPFKEGMLKYWANRENSERFGERYVAPIVLTDSMYVKFRYFAADRDASIMTRLDFAEHAATGDHVSLITKPFPSSKEADADYLINGIVGKPGKWRYNQEWLEFGAEGFAGRIDLKDTLSHSLIRWYFGNDPNQGIHPPKDIAVSIGNSIDNLKKVQKIHLRKRRKDRMYMYEIKIPPTAFRYIELKATPVPDKKKNRLMVGEIEVNWH